MPPRPRPSFVVNEEPHPNRPRQHVFAPNFNNEEEADLILRSSSGTSFLVQKLCLQANSTVFADMLVIGHVKPDGSGAQHRPDVDVSEEDASLEIFLRFVHPSRYLINDLPPIPANPSPQYHVLFALFTTLDKYGCQHLLDLTTRLYIPVLSERGAVLSAWVLAVRFGGITAARAALKSFGKFGKMQMGCRRWDMGSGKWIMHERERRLGDFSDPEKLAGLPLQAIVSFSKVQSRVASCADGSYTWENAAKDFSF